MTHPFLSNEPTETLSMAFIVHIFIRTYPLYKTLQIRWIYHKRWAEGLRELNPHSSVVPTLLGGLTPIVWASAAVQHFSWSFLVYIGLQRCTMSMLTVYVPIFNNLESVLIYCIVEAVRRGKKMTVKRLFLNTWRYRNDIYSDYFRLFVRRDVFDRCSELCGDNSTISLLDLAK